MNLIIISLCGYLRMRSSRPLLVVRGDGDDELCSLLRKQEEDAP